jgi:cation transport ATPase
MYINTHSNLRPEAVEVVRKIEDEEKLEVHILSGDSEGSVIRLGNNLDISRKRLHGGKKATEKVDWVR